MPHHILSAHETAAPLPPDSPPPGSVPPESVPPESAFGALVRRLRRARNLPLSTAARAAGIGRVTLHRWEQGAQRPRLPELEALLEALDIGAGERRRVLSLLDTSGAQAQIRQEIARINDSLRLGPMPGGAELLRAMRRRRGASADEVAHRIGVTGRTIRRWEQGDAWPPLDRLHAFCLALGAREAEVVALTVGNFARAPLGSEEDAPDPRDLWERLWRLHARFASGGETLIELHYLPLTARAWEMAARSEAGREVLRFAYHCQGMDHGHRDDHAGALCMAERVLDLGPGPAAARPRKSFTYSSVIVAESHLAKGGDAAGGRRAFEILSPLVELTPLYFMKAWILSLMADSLAAQGAWEEALALGTQAIRVSERSEYAGEWELRCRDQAERMLRQGRWGAALGVLEEIRIENPFDLVRAHLSRAQAMAGLGDVAGAAACLRSAYALIETQDAPHLRAHADRVAAGLPH